MFKKYAICLIMVCVLVMGLAGCAKKQAPQPAPVSVAPQGDVGGIHYSVTENASYFRKSKTAGYYIDTLDEPNAPYFVFITSGEKKTSGYNVVVTGIDVDANSDVKITVQFTEPESKANVTKGKTYPVTQVTLDQMPGDVTVELTDGSTLIWLE